MGMVAVEVHVMEIGVTDCVVCLFVCMYVCLFDLGYY